MLNFIGGFKFFWFNLLILQKYCKSISNSCQLEINLNPEKLKKYLIGELT
jgi:hypothetical protein